LVAWQRAMKASPSNSCDATSFCRQPCEGQGWNRSSLPRCVRSCSLCRRRPVHVSHRPWACSRRKRRQVSTFACPSRFRLAQRLLHALRDPEHLACVGVQCGHGAARFAALIVEIAADQRLRAGHRHVKPSGMKSRRALRLLSPVLICIFQSSLATRWKSIKQTGILLKTTAKRGRSGYSRAGSRAPRRLRNTFVAKGKGRTEGRRDYSRCRSLCVAKLAAGERRGDPGANLALQLKVSNILLERTNRPFLVELTSRRIDRGSG